MPFLAISPTARDLPPRCEPAGPVASSGRWFSDKNRSSVSSGPSSTSAGSWATCARCSASPVSASKSVCTVSTTFSSTWRLSSWSSFRTSRVRSASVVSGGRTYVNAPGASPCSPAMTAPVASRFWTTMSAGPGSPVGTRQVSRSVAMTRTSRAARPPTSTRTVGGGGVVGPSAGGGSGSWKPAPESSTSNPPPVGPELGVMVVIDGTGIFVRQTQKSPGTVGKDGTGARVVRQPNRGGRIRCVSYYRKLGWYVSTAAKQCRGSE